MLPTSSLQNNSLQQSSNALPAYDSSWSINEIATCVFKTLGVFLVVTGVGCLIAGLNIPAIALIVSGVASWLLGSVIPKKEVQPAPLFPNRNPRELQASLDNAKADFLRTAAPFF
jgi:hypothetical protein